MRGRHAAPPRQRYGLPQPDSRDRTARAAVVTRPATDGQARPTRQPMVAAGLAILAAMAVFCFLGPLFYRPDLQHVNLLLANLPPGGGHLLGTDQDGVDVLGRLMTGGQISLEVGVAAGLLASVIGSLWGAVAGYVGRCRSTRCMMRVVDAGIAIPAIILLLAPDVRLPAVPGDPDRRHRGHLLAEHRQARARRRADAAQQGVRSGGRRRWAVAGRGS